MWQISFVNFCPHVYRINVARLADRPYRRLRGEAGMDKRYLSHKKWSCIIYNVTIGTSGTVVGLLISVVVYCVHCKTIHSSEFNGLFAQTRCHRHTPETTASYFTYSVRRCGMHSFHNPTTHSARYINKSSSAGKFSTAAPAVNILPRQFYYRTHYSGMSCALRALHPLKNSPYDIPSNRKRWMERCNQSSLKTVFVRAES
jgi:hypothetical protein